MVWSPAGRLGVRRHVEAPRKRRPRARAGARAGLPARGPLPCFIVEVATGSWQERHWVSRPWQSAQISESATGTALGDGSVGYPQSGGRGRNKIQSEAEHRVMGRGCGLNGGAGTSEGCSPFPSGGRTWLLAEKTVKFGAN